MSARTPRRPSVARRSQQFRAFTLPRLQAKEPDLDEIDDGDDVWGNRPPVRVNIPPGTMAGVSGQEVRAGWEEEKVVIDTSVKLFHPELDAPERQTQLVQFYTQPPLSVPSQVESPSKFTASTSSLAGSEHPATADSVPSVAQGATPTSNAIPPETTTVLSGDSTPLHQSKRGSGASLYNSSGSRNRSTNTRPSSSSMNSGSGGGVASTSAMSANGSLSSIPGQGKDAVDGSSSMTSSLSLRTVEITEDVLLVFQKEAADRCRIETLQKFEFETYVPMEAEERAARYAQWMYHCEYEEQWEREAFETDSDVAFNDLCRICLHAAYQDEIIRKERKARAVIASEQLDAVLFLWSGPPAFTGGIAPMPTTPEGEDRPLALLDHFFTLMGELQLSDWSTIMTQWRQGYPLTHVQHQWDRTRVRMERWEQEQWGDLEVDFTSYRDSRAVVESEESSRRAIESEFATSFSRYLLLWSHNLRSVWFAMEVELAEGATVAQTTFAAALRIQRFFRNFRYRRGCLEAARQQRMAAAVGDLDEIMALDYDPDDAAYRVNDPPPMRSYTPEEEDGDDEEEEEEKEEEVLEDEGKDVQEIGEEDQAVVEGENNHVDDQEDEEVPLPLPTEEDVVRMQSLVRQRAAADRTAQLRADASSKNPEKEVEPNQVAAVDDEDEGHEGANEDASCHQPRPVEGSATEDSRRDQHELAAGTEREDDEDKLTPAGGDDTPQVEVDDAPTDLTDDEEEECVTPPADDVEEENPTAGGGAIDDYGDDDDDDLEL